MDLYLLCAWAFTGCFSVCYAVSFLTLSVRKKYPIQYDLKAIGMYVLLAAVLYVAAEYVSIDISICVWHIVQFCCYCLLRMSLSVIYR